VREIEIAGERERERESEREVESFAHMIILNLTAVGVIPAPSRPRSLNPTH